jgi:Flp pilus assembly protein TadB
MRLLDVVVGKVKAGFAPFKALVKVNHESQDTLFTVWSSIAAIMVRCKPLAWVIPIESKTLI